MTQPPRRYLSTPVPRMIAHRGLAEDHDENTLTAFRRALDAGADVIETDTRATADGVALTFHDASTGRLACADYMVERTRYSTLEGLGIGSGTITRLEDALTAFPHARFNIDVKSMHAALPTARAIASHHAVQRVCLASFDGRVAACVRDAVRDLTGMEPTMSASRSTVQAFRAAVAVGAPQSVIDAILRPVAALQIPVSYGRIPLVTARTIAAAHRAGCEVHVWTIDSPQEMESLLNAGVDGIVTNRVDVLACVLGRGM